MRGQHGASSEHEEAAFFTTRALICIQSRESYVTSCFGFFTLKCKPPL